MSQSVKCISSNRRTLVLKCHLDTCFDFFFFFNLKEHDEPILKHLKDIKVKFSDAGQPMVKESWNISSFVALDAYKVDQWNFIKKGDVQQLDKGVRRIWNWYLVLSIVRIKVLMWW